MNKINNVIICGLGAIGTIYAEKLKGCTNLKILADEKRIERYKKNPVIFNGKNAILILFCRMRKILRLI